MCYNTLVFVAFAVLHLARYISTLPYKMATRLRLVTGRFTNISGHYVILLCVKPL